MTYTNEEIENEIRNDLELFVIKSFITLNPGKKFKNNWHVGLICDYFSAMIRGDFLKLIVNQPPSTLKSTVGTISVPAFILGHDPSAQILCSSHDKALATGLAVKSRVVMASDWYRKVFPNTIIQTGENEKANFTTTKRGYRLSVSTASGFTGQKGDWLFADDPHDAKDIHSETKRVGVLYNFYEEAWKNRANDLNTARMMLNMQRLHEQDLTGHILAQETGWELLKIPLEAPQKLIFISPLAADRIYKTMEKGEILQPSRFNAETVANIKRREQYFATQYQQEPAPMEGGLFKRKDIVRYDLLPPVAKWWLSIDPNNKQGEKNDYSSIGIWGEYENNYYLTDRIKGQYSYSQLKTITINTINSRRFEAVIIENIGNGIALIDDVRNECNVTVIPSNPARGSKYYRAEQEAVQVIGGRLRVPKVAPHAEEYIDQLAVFPNGTHDDDVDMTSQFLAEMRNKPAPYRAKTNRTGFEERTKGAF